MARKRFRKRPISEINVVPYIDVMLVLLVIFMVTAPLLTQGVKVDLPQAPAQPVDRRNQEPLLVKVDKDARYYIHYGGNPNEPVDAPTLVNRAAAVLRRNPGIPVLVEGDKAAAYGDVVAAMSLLQAAGAPSVGLVTMPPENAGP